jgi:hypothetical protein
MVAALYIAGLLFLTIVGSGCSAPAQIHWNPDGTAAAYAYRGQAMVVDADGAVLSKLGKSEGGFAWSADGKTLYYAAVTDNADNVIEIGTQWVKESTDAGARTPTAPSTRPEGQIVELSTWSNRKSTPLVKFRADAVVYMILSPDQEWLAFATEQDEHYANYVCHLPSKKVMLLSKPAGLAMCFTGKNRLAFVERASGRESVDFKTAGGHVSEVTLDAKTDKLTRTPLIDVVAGETYWLAALGEDLLLTAVSRTMPGKPIAEDDLLAHCKLFMWTRANNGIVAVADNAGPLFALSPDGKRVLIHKITPRNDKMAMMLELQVIYANGSGGMTLRTTREGDPLPMWPAWRTDSQITLNAPEPKSETRAGEPRQVFDVTTFTLTDKGELINGKVLSGSWDPDLRPHEKAPATTQKN